MDQYHEDETVRQGVFGKAVRCTRISDSKASVPPEILHILILRYCFILMGHSTQPCEPIDVTRSTLHGCVLDTSDSGVGRQHGNTVRDPSALLPRLLGVPVADFPGSHSFAPLGAFFALTTAGVHYQESKCIHAFSRGPGRGQSAS